jgi:hypothetical protein
MTIDASNHIVNPAFEIDELEAIRDKALDRAVAILKKLKPEAFEQELWRQIEGLQPFCDKGLLDDAHMRGYFLLAAGKRENYKDIVWQAIPDRVDFGGFDDGDGAYAPTPAIIKKILPRDGFVIIGGQSRAGKTYMAINLAICLATGLPFLGHHPKHKSAIVYAAAEGAGTIQPRINAAKKHLNIDKRLPIRVLRRLNFPTDEKQFNHYVHELGREIDQHRQKTGMQHATLFIDTAAAAFPMSDENSAAEISRLCTACRNIADYFGVLVILVHHYGKDQTRGLRGSSAWTANADHVFGVLAERDALTAEAGARNIIMDKNRLQGGWEGPLTGFKLVSIPMGVDEDGDLWSEAALEMTEFARKDGDATKATKRKRSAAEVHLREAYNQICNPDTRRSVAGTGPSIPAVMLDMVEAEFKRRYPVCGSTEKNRKDAARNAFNRALDAAIAAREMCTENHRGEWWIWDPKAERLL